MANLKVKLFAAASANAGLQALLGTNPFRWTDIQLPQQSAFPAVTVNIISNPRMYATTGRMQTSITRVQFSIFGAGPDSTNADAVAAALLAFLDGFNAAGMSGLPANSNQVVGDRDAGFVQTAPMTYLRIIDCVIFQNETL